MTIDTSQAQTGPQGFASGSTGVEPGEILAALPYAVYWKDPDGRYLGWNPAFLTLRGLPAGAGIGGLSEDRLPVKDAFSQNLPTLEASAASTGLPASGMQSVGGSGPSEPSRHVLLTVMPLRTGDGKSRGIVGLAADISNESDIETKLSHAIRLEGIRSLARATAHQVNTPLQFITDNTRFVADNVASVLQGLAAIAALVEGAGADPEGADSVVGRVRELLRGLDVEFLGEELPQALLQTLEGLSQIAQVVTTLKVFSRDEGTPVDVDLNAAIVNVVDLAGGYWMPVADLRLHLDPGMGVVPCYEGEIRQALLDLIVNATQSITARMEREPGYTQGVVEISSRRENDRVTIVVRDDGAELDDVTKSRIFDPFFSAEDIAPDSGQGLGLAYTTVVARHRGSMDVTSSPGEHTTFTLTLPCSMVARGPAPVLSPPADAVLDTIAHTPAWAMPAPRDGRTPA